MALWLQPLSGGVVMLDCMPRKTTKKSRLPEASAIKRRGRKPKPIEQRPTPLWTEWTDPEDFAEALDLHMRRHGDSAHHLQKVLAVAGPTVNVTTVRTWRRGTKTPGDATSLRALELMDERYGLPEGYFRGKLPPTGRAIANHRLPNLSVSERRRLAWHLPHNFDRLPRAKQEEIVTWVRKVIISGSTDYRRYQAAASRQPFAVRFPCARRFSSKPASQKPPARPRPGILIAPKALDLEMETLLTFKTAILSPRGFERSGVWGPETAKLKSDHIGLMFGALAASPTSEIRGAGVPLDRLSFGLLAFPAVWDWYLEWRQARRGLYTGWEIEMLMLSAALLRPGSGWVRQTPSLAQRLGPVEGLVSQAQIDLARADWEGLCDLARRHVLHRAKEVTRVAIKHRDPFEPVLTILESDSPLTAYRQITEEVLRRTPNPRRYPVPAAEACRAFLMLRLGLHLGVRQKNLRQLRICQHGAPPSAERQLETLKCGELRWNDKQVGWEIFIPAVAFKNAGSSYFGRQPFRLALPDLGGLYEQINAYLRRHRTRLLADAPDPGTLFVKTVKSTSESPVYDQSTFYEAWRLAIQRYGIFNPYTGCGAIRGLLPHGPHSLRDVLATHILKKTGSYEQASYAIQDTPETVARHYGRFLPQDKAALAARVLNQAWADE